MVTYHNLLEKIDDIYIYDYKKFPQNSFVDVVAPFN